MKTQMRTAPIISWIIAAWISIIFASSLPFKLTNAPETQHIFQTIGQWLSEFLGEGIGNAFGNFGGYVIGSLELIVTLILLAPMVVLIINKIRKNKKITPLDSPLFHTIGGLGASALMGGAVFFHLFSRLGIEVQDDGGALFYTALSVFVLGIILFLINRDNGPCPKKTLVGHFLHSLKPRSWKSPLFWVELVPVVLVTALTGLLGFYVHQAYTDRYPNQEVASVPVFEEITLPFEHKYSVEKSLPFLASAVIDVDNDGIEEIYLGGGLSQADVLYTYKNGEFIDVSDKHNIGGKKHSESLGVAVLDMDKNGWNDLVIARENGVVISYNRNGQFEETKLNLPFNDISTPLSVALGDINKDGHVDMFVATYIRNRFVETQTGFNVPNYGASSLLFLNNGDNTFTDITKSAGMDYIHNTFQGNFVDLDGDQDVDLVVSYDTGQVRTWRNNGNSTFTNMENPTSNQYGYPMGNAVGDYNNDGLVDFAFSNVGNLGPMNKIVRGDLTKDQIFNPKIIVLRNDGNFKFTDTAEEINISNYEFSWGMLFEDFNADTRQDLVMAQNYVQLPYNRIAYSPGRFLLQAENGKFTDKEKDCLLYTSPSPRDQRGSRMPSSA